jgi:hypothetical protein
MAQYREYQAPAVGQQKCTYSNLRSTYQGQAAQGRSASMAQYVVPQLCPNGPTNYTYPPAYDTFSHGQQYTCGGYFGMKGAYPRANCTTCNAPYTKRDCRGRLSCANK